MRSLWSCMVVCGSSGNEIIKVSAARAVERRSMRPPGWADCTSIERPDSAVFVYTESFMAENSFDIVSKVDLQEVSNAINQALKEIHTRFDLKDSKSNI